jgi:hypothetical protein
MAARFRPEQGAPRIKERRVKATNVDEIRSGLEQEVARGREELTPLLEAIESTDNEITRLQGLMGKYLEAISHAADDAKADIGNKPCLPMSLLRLETATSELNHVAELGNKHVHQHQSLAKLLKIAESLLDASPSRG